MSNNNLANAQNGSVVQAGVALEVPAMVTINDATETEYLTGNSHIETQFKADSDFYISNVSIDSNPTRIFKTSSFIVQGEDQTVYLKSPSGDIDVYVAINKGLV